MSKGLLEILIDKIFDSIFTPEYVGKYGEQLTARELKLVKFFGRDGKILRNVYIPKDNGETSEIDVMFITQKGIFVFESKNYSGWIFGNEKDGYWTAMLENRMKNRFYNPIKQNRTHIKWLGNYLGEGIPLFSVIVFSERCELKKVTVQSTDIHVIKRDRTYATVREIWESVPDVLSDEQVDGIYEKLKVLTEVSEAEKQTHIDQINAKYHKGEKAGGTINEEEIASDGNDDNDNDVISTDTIFADTVTANETVSINGGNIAEESKADESAGDLVCPRCGGKLVLRTAKRGENKGRQFYGCSNFPKCRYIQNI